MAGGPSSSDVESVVFQDIRVTKNDAPIYTLAEKPIDIWNDQYEYFHSRAPVNYVRDRILASETNGSDLFPSIIGKSREKELVKTALLSASPILFRGEKGYGKTTFSKAISNLLPERLLAIKDCSVHDDPTQPTCFSCKNKLMNEKEIELTWVPRIWVRISGDPLLTTRQLVGGISIQKIREGYDLDHPEVFIPGRALKSNRGVSYFDELGAIPTSLQTLLHELFEEHQITSSEGDIVPFKITSLEIAATNPTNYRGTSPIKEPLLDRMEEIKIGPPETLEEEMEIGKRNMFQLTTRNPSTQMPSWHLKTLARTVRLGRGDSSQAAKKIQSEPSCRGTIKLLDHVKSHALRSGREVPLLSDYGQENEIIDLALAGRIELEYSVKESKHEIISQLLEEALRETCKEIYDKIPADGFDPFLEDIAKYADLRDDQKIIRIRQETVEGLRSSETINSIVGEVLQDDVKLDQLFLSYFEMILHAISICAPTTLRKEDGGYAIQGLTQSETSVRSV